MQYLISTKRRHLILCTMYEKERKKERRKGQGRIGLFMNHAIFLAGR